MGGLAVGVQVAVTEASLLTVETENDLGVTVSEGDGDSALTEREGERERVRQVAVNEMDVGVTERVAEPLAETDVVGCCVQLRVGLAVRDDADKEGVGVWERLRVGELLSDSSTEEEGVGEGKETVTVCVEV